MEANEIRIGNLVRIKNSATETAPPWDVVATSITKQKNGYFVSYDGGACHVDNIEGVPLKDEHLIKFKFQRVNIDVPGYGKEGKIYMCRYNNKFFYTSAQGYEFEIKTVHHLQNLCLDLTLKELIWQKQPAQSPPES